MEGTGKSGRFSAGFCWIGDIGRYGAEGAFLFGFWRKDGFWIFMEELRRADVSGWVFYRRVFFKEGAGRSGRFSSNGSELGGIGRYGEKFSFLIKWKCGDGVKKERGGVDVSIQAF